MVNVSKEKFKEIVLKFIRGKWTFKKYYFSDEEFEILWNAYNAYCPKTMLVCGSCRKKSFDKSKIGKRCEKVSYRTVRRPGFIGFTWHPQIAEEERDTCSGRFYQVSNETYWEEIFQNQLQGVFTAIVHFEENGNKKQHQITEFLLTPRMMLYCCCMTSEPTKPSAIEIIRSALPKECANIKCGRAYERWCNNHKIDYTFRNLELNRIPQCNILLKNIASGEKQMKEITKKVQKAKTEFPTAALDWIDQKRKV